MKLTQSMYTVLQNTTEGVGMQFYKLASGVSYVLMPLLFFGLQLNRNSFLYHKRSHNNKIFCNAVSYFTAHNN